MRTQNQSSTTTPKSMAAESGGTDAISLLIQDHELVKDLFEQFESLTDRAKVSKKRLADEICAELTMHTLLEEEIFYPAVRGAGKEFADLIDEAVVEHASAKQLIAEIEAMDPGEDLYDAKVKVLSEMIEHHVKEEEEEMFPKVRKAGLDLAALGEQMEQRKGEPQLGTAV